MPAIDATVGGAASNSYETLAEANFYFDERLPLNPPFFFESDTIYDLTRPGDIRAGYTDVLPLTVPSGQVRA